MHLCKTFGAPMSEKDAAYNRLSFSLVSSSDYPQLRQPFSSKKTKLTKKGAILLQDRDLKIITLNEIFLMLIPC